MKKTRDFDLHEDECHETLEERRSRVARELVESVATDRQRGEYAKRRPRMSLRSLREASGVTQVEMAERMKIAQGEVSRIERRDVRMSTLKRYAAAFGGTLHIGIEIDGRTYWVELGDLRTGDER